MNPWDQRYEGAGFAYGTEPNDFLKEMAPRLRPNGRVLCLAEGEGRNAVFLASLGHDVTGVDGSAVGLEKARGLANERGVTLLTVHADLADYSIPPGSWDAIVSIWCHLPRALRSVVHGKAARGLVPGGLFVLEAYRPKQLEYKTGGPPTVELLPSLEDLKSELEGLEVLIGREVDRDVTEGRLHQGLSAVVQVLARRPLPR